MNLGLAPSLVCLVALGLLVPAVGVGLLLQRSPRWKRTGKRLVRYSAASLLGTIIFAWLGLLVGGLLDLVFGHQGMSVGLWGSGPAGFLGALALVRHEEKHDRSTSAVGWWLASGIALVLLAFGLRLTWQASKEMGPHKHTVRVPKDNR